MISRVAGNIILRSDKFLVLETGGIGYKIFVTPDEMGKHAGQSSAILWTRDYVKEDARDLYGFSDYQELAFFELLIQISGIGPKSALGIMAVVPMKTLRRAIASSDNSYLTKVSGIGRKTADKIILELRDKMTASDEETESLRGESDAIEALKSLGYSSRDAREALRAVSQDVISINEKIKQALRILGRNNK